MPRKFWAESVGFGLFILIFAVGGIMAVFMQMKRFVFTLMIAFAAFGAAFAQLRYGLGAGVEIADARLSGAPGVAMDNRAGFRGGFLLEYQTAGGLAFDGSLLYVRYNARPEIAGATAAGVMRDFIQVPLHVKYKFWLPSTNNLIAPMALTGPAFAFGPGGNGGPLAQTRFQFGWDVGVGVDAANIVQLTGGYRFGLGNACSGSAATLRTSGWFVSLALLFDF